MGSSLDEGDQKVALFPILSSIHSILFFFSIWHLTTFTVTFREMPGKKKKKIEKIEKMELDREWDVSRTLLLISGFRV